MYKENSSDSYFGVPCESLWWKIFGLSILILLIVACGVAAGNMMKQANEQQTQCINNRKCQCGCGKIGCDCENFESNHRHSGPGFRSGSSIKYGRWY